MKISVITQDQTVVVGGQGLPVSFQVPAGEWAIHFDTDISLGEVEYIDNRDNERITNFDKYQYLVDAWQAESDRIAAEMAQAEAEAERLAAEAEAQADTVA